MEAKKIKLDAEAATAVMPELDPVVIISLSSPDTIKECLLLPHSPIEINADTTTPEGAVEKFKSLIDDLALTNKGKFARFREGNKIPLHYQDFSCSNEQIFADVVAGDRRWYNEIISNNLSLGMYLVVTGSESKMVITCKRVGGFDKLIS